MYRNCLHDNIVRNRKVNNAVLILLLIFSKSLSQIEELPLKALFLEAAIRFVTWPEVSDRIKDNKTGDKFRIGVFCNDKFVPYVEKTFAQKKVKERGVRIVCIESIDKIPSCDMIIIPGKQKKNISEIIKNTRGKPVLTISSNIEMAQNGVVLCIVTERGKIRCYINEKEASLSKRKISHHLLQKSEIVQTTEGE